MLITVTHKSTVARTVMCCQDGRGPFPVLLDDLSKCRTNSGPKAIYFSWFGPELFCLLLGPPGFNCWFSSAPVFQWCCSTPQGSPGVGRNTFLSSPHLCFIIVFICDLFVSRDDPLMS